MSKANLSIVAQSNVTEVLKDLGNAIGQSIKVSEVIDTKIAALRELKVTTLGDTRKDKNAAFLRDTIVACGVSKETAKVYLSYVRYALENNKPFSNNVSQDKKRADAKKKAEEKTDADKMIAALLNVWKLSDAAEECLIAIETIMADGTPLIDAIAEVLREAGEKLE